MAAATPLRDYMEVLPSATSDDVFRADGTMTFSDSTADGKAAGSAISPRKGASAATSTHRTRTESNSSRSSFNRRGSTYIVQWGQQQDAGASDLAPPQCDDSNGRTRAGSLSCTGAGDSSSTPLSQRSASTGQVEEEEGRRCSGDDSPTPTNGLSLPIHHGSDEGNASERSLSMDGAAKTEEPATVTPSPTTTNEPCSSGCLRKRVGNGRWRHNWADSGLVTSVCSGGAVTPPPSSTSNATPTLRSVTPLIVTRRQRGSARATPTSICVESSCCSSSVADRDDQPHTRTQLSAAARSFVPRGLEPFASSCSAPNTPCIAVVPLPRPYSPITPRHAWVPVGRGATACRTPSSETFDAATTTTIGTLDSTPQLRPLSEETVGPQHTRTASLATLASSRSPASIGPMFMGNNKWERDEYAIHYKTRPCPTYAETGSCEFGDRCHFAHGKKDRRSHGQNKRAGLTTMQAIREFLEIRELVAAAKSQAANGEEVTAAPT